MTVQGWQLWQVVTRNQRKLRTYLFIDRSGALSVDQVKVRCGKLQPCELSVCQLKTGDVEVLNTEEILLISSGAELVELNY